MSDITEDQFWGILSEPEPVIKILKYFKIYKWYNEQGKRHRENDLPADIWYRTDGSIYRKIWYQNNEYHRIGGPAQIWYENDGSLFNDYWYLNNKEYTEENYWKKLKELGYDC